MVVDPLNLILLCRYLSCKLIIVVKCRYLRSLLRGTMNYVSSRFTHIYCRPYTAVCLKNYILLFRLVRQISESSTSVVVEWHFMQILWLVMRKEERQEYQRWAWAGATFQLSLELWFEQRSNALRRTTVFNIRYAQTACVRAPLCSRHISSVTAKMVFSSRNNLVKAGRVVRCPNHRGRTSRNQTSFVSRYAALSSLGKARGKTSAFYMSCVWILRL